MRKILIVGHPSSRYEGVERLLNDCGMGVAKPSRREGMTPSEIGTTLLEAHGVAPSQLVDDQNRVRRVEVGPLWNGLALDLMLGNLDQPLWGWSDPCSVSLLNYWSTLDSNITFMLVYDDPGTVLTRGNGANGKMSRELLGVRVRDWCAYNAELLRFFHRNTDRCLLVHGQQVRLSAQRYLQQVRARLDASGGGRGLLRASHEAASAMEPARESPEESAEERVGHVEDALADYLADALMQQFPEALELYEELQSVASLPLAEPEVNELARRAPGNGHGSDESALAAWQCMIALHRTKRDREVALQEVQERLRAEQARLCAEQVRMEDLRLDLVRTREQSEARIQDLEQAREGLEHTQRESSEENDLLLRQLHQTQEELERLVLEREDQKATIDSLGKTKKEAEERGKQLEALKRRVDEREKQVAEWRKRAEERGNEVKDWQRRLQEQEKLVSERAKQTEAREKDLEALRRQLEDYEQERAAGADAQELEKEIDRLLEQLHEVQGELESYYLQNQALKGTGLVKLETVSQSLAPYGAAERVKGWLSYRLGACMIERSRSFWGWLTMPFALMAVVLRFRSELPQRRALKLPPISRYADADKAERVKRHLSYRLGTALIANASNPFRWFVLPWALRREVKEFRRSKRP